jgi:Phage tail tube protein
MGAKGSQAGLGYLKEVVWGVTPTGQFTGINFSSEDFTYGIEKKPSNNIRPDRQTTDLIPVDADCEGGFEVDFQAENLDGLFPAFFMVSDWTADVIQNGVQRTSFSFERINTDVTQFFLYPGMVPNILELEIESGEPVIAKMSFVGKDEALNQVTASSPVASDPSTKPVMSVSSSIGEIAIDDVAVSACLIEKASIKLDNQTKGKKGVGVLGNCDSDANSLMVTGALSLFFNDETYYDMYLASTPFKLTINFIDSLGNEYDLELPKCVFDEGNANVTGKDDDVKTPFTFTAVMGAGGYTIKLTRTVIV